MVTLNSRVMATLQRDEYAPLGFVAGDANLFRYVKNSPTNFTDPSGLWTWRMDEQGHVFAVSEESDSLNDLIGQGYNQALVKALAKEKGFNDLAAKLKSGIELDITSLLPKDVQAVLARQQQMSYEALRQRVENTPGGPKNVPKDKTVGSCGIDWFQDKEEGEDGTDKKGFYFDHNFGWSNCYGFAALILGQKPPQGCSPEHFNLGGLKGEGVAGGVEDKPRTYNPFEKYLPDKRYEGVRVVVPEGGIIKMLTAGLKPTDKPRFGAVALFSNELGVTHAGIVLGRNQKGDVIVIQKLNAAQACGISTTTHPRLRTFGKPTYYQ